MIASTSPAARPYTQRQPDLRTRYGDRKTSMQVKEEPKAESEASLDIFESLVQQLPAAKESSEADRVSSVVS